MSVSQIRAYLKKIDEGKPINYLKFQSLVSSLKLSYDLGSRSIHARKIKGSLYLVTISSSELMVALKKYAELDTDNRSSLATQNKSHSQNASGSILTCRKGKDYPFVTVFDKTGYFEYPTDYLPGLTCLVIENLENFLHIDKTLDLINTVIPIIPNQLEVVFASGMSVANALHKKYFEQFNEILLFLDVDEGGLRIAAALHNLAPKIPIEFLIAPNTETLLDNVESKQTADTLRKIEEIGRNHVFLSKVTKLIKTHRATIEQEAFLQ